MTGALSRTGDDSWGAAVVFDCDGLLLDTEECWAEAEGALFAEHGHTYGPEERRLLLGAGPAEADGILARLFGLRDQGGRLYGRLLELATAEVAAGSRARPGAEELLQWLPGRVRRGVASNSPRSFLEAALGGADLWRAFDAIVGADDVANAKPAPDPYLLACRRLGADPTLSVALEDSPTGVASARAAGMFVVGVPSVGGVALDADLVAPSLSDPAVIQALSDKLHLPKA